jgi:hypothetical protein
MANQIIEQSSVGMRYKPCHIKPMTWLFAVSCLALSREIKNSCAGLSRGWLPSLLKAACGK